MATKALIALFFASFLLDPAAEARARTPHRSTIVSITTGNSTTFVKPHGRTVARRKTHRHRRG
jgi:hypothetical protein